MSNGEPEVNWVLDTGVREGLIEFDPQYGDLSSRMAGEVWGREIAKYAKELAAIAAAMEKGQTEYAKLVSSNEEKTLFDEFKRERRRYLDENMKVMRLSDNGHTEDAKQLFRYNSQQKYDRAAVALNVSKRGARA